MKRMRIVFLAAVVVAMLAMPATAFAEHLSGSNNWTVTFNPEEKMVDNYSSKDWADDISGLEPGDDITFTVTLKHDNKSKADWYMSNEVLKSLEEGAAEGSAYGYYLTYTGPSGGTPRVLFNSEKVGGTGSKEGLGEATSGLEDYLFLDTMSQGQTAQVKLKVTLDGETEGNAYFDTLARLKMKWAVELVEDNPNNNPPNKPNTPTGGKGTVQTGDESNLFPFFVAMAVSGGLLLVIAILSLRSRRKKEGQHA